LRHKELLIINNKLTQMGEPQKVVKELEGQIDEIL
jgi:hypothetical protein